MYFFRKYRELAGLTQKQAAISLRIKPPSMVEWEKGTTNPTIENLIKMSALYGVSVDALLGLDEASDRPASAHPFLSAAEQKLIAGFRDLNRQGQEYVLQAVHTAVASGIYKKPVDVPSVEP